MFVVRQASTVDVEWMALLWSAWCYEKGLQFPDVDAWASIQREGIRLKTIVAVVAQSESGEMVGFTDGSIGYEPGTRERFLMGRHIFLRPECRGKGLGERMQIRLLSLANQSGAGYMLTHGTPSGHAVEKLFGRPMEPYGEVRIARWAPKT